MVHFTRAAVLSTEPAKRALALTSLLLLGLWATLGACSKPAAKKANPSTPTVQRPTAIDQPELVLPDESLDAEGADAGVAVDAPVKARRKVDAEQACSGELSAAEARAVIDANRAPVRACYERQLKNNNNLAGELVLRLRVGKGGRVDDVRISGSLRDRQVNDCVQTLAKKWRFPTPNEGDCALISAPFNFSPKNAL